jgi:hypothetical protein
MKVFWSWQSDTPEKLGRFLVRDALDKAIGQLNKALDVIEPEAREKAVAMRPDSDTAGKPGSPPIVSTVFEKIGEATVFLADVTPVSTISAGKGDAADVKYIMNPNVAIELGYALRGRLGTGGVIMVLNTHYGSPPDCLPFDIRHLRWPIPFNLPPDAGHLSKSVEKDLTGALVEALKRYLTIEPAPEGQTPAVYFESGEVLAQKDATTYSYPDGRGFYLRVIPHDLPPAPILKDASSVAPGTLQSAMFRSADGGSVVERNKYGIIVMDAGASERGVLEASTQLFTSGEMWGLARWPLRYSKPIGNYVPARALEETYRRALDQYVAVAKVLGITPPVTIKAGGVGLQGYRLLVDAPDIADSSRRFLEDHVPIERVLKSYSKHDTDAVLLEIFESMFLRAGSPRPKGLFGFGGPSKKSKI